MKNIVTAATLVMILAGCATANMGEAKQDAVLKTFTIAPDKSGLYIY